MDPRGGIICWACHDSCKLTCINCSLILICREESFRVSHYLPTTKQVVEPIERMVRLLSMLMKDPLGYQNSQQYRKLKQEDDEAAAVSMWPKDALKGK